MLKKCLFFPAGEVPLGLGHTQPRQDPIPNTTVDGHFQSFCNNVKASEYWKYGKLTNLEEFLLAYMGVNQRGC